MLILSKFKKIVMFKNSDTTSIILLLLLLVATTFMYDYFYMQVEKVDSIITMVYYNIVTASTVGYGDLSPQTEMGRIITIIYIPVAISIFATILSILGSLVYQRINKKNIGFKYINKSIDYVIIGGNNEQVETICEKLLEEDKTIVLVNMLHKIKPYIYKKMGVEWIYGSGSYDNALTMINHEEVGEYIILRQNSSGVESDSEALYILEKLSLINKKRTIVESSGRHSYMKEYKNVTFMLPTKSSFIAREILSANFISNIQALSDNSQELNQYNVVFKDEGTTWEKVVNMYQGMSSLPVGYLNKDNKWVFFPKKLDLVDKNSLIKIIVSSTEKTIPLLEKKIQNILIVGHNDNRIKRLIENYRLDDRYVDSTFTISNRLGNTKNTDGINIEYEELYENIRCSQEFIEKFTHIIIMGNNGEEKINGENVFLWKSIRALSSKVKIIMEIVGDSFVKDIEYKYEDRNNEFVSFFNTEVLTQEIQDEGVINLLENISDKEIININNWRKEVE